MANHLEQMVLGVDAFDCGIQKRLVYAGKEPVIYVDGTKVIFSRFLLFILQRPNFNNFQIRYIFIIKQ